MEKQCTKCGDTKPFTDFHTKSSRKDGRQAVCKVCQNKYTQQHYKDNKPYYVAKAKKRNKIVIAGLRQKIWEYLSTHPCVDCGESEIVFLEFDHVRGEKFMEVSRMVQGWSWESIQQEIAKCDVRCMKCHRLKTYREIGWQCPSKYNKDS